MEKFTISQKKLVIACVLAYTSAYVCRLNLSAVLSGIMDGMNISAAKAGILPTVFAVVYAVGQLVNGAIADRVNPVRHILIGLCGTIICNALMGASVNFAMLLIFCMLNGVFQSMLWTPIVRLLAMYFQEGRVRTRANFFISLTLCAGHLAAWLLAGLISENINWRSAYYASAGIVVPISALVAFLLISGRKRAVEIEVPKHESKGKSTGAFGIFMRTGFLFVLLGCVLYGFVKDGIVTWTPTILGSLAGDAKISSTTFSLIIPVINCAGIIAGYRFTRMKNSGPRRVSAFMMLAAAALALPLLLGGNLLVTALITGLCCACLYGLNPMLTALVPLEYYKLKCVGLAAGLVDCFIYLGSSLSGVIEGSIYDSFGTNALFISWAVAVAGAGLITLISVRKKFVDGLK